MDPQREWEEKHVESPQRLGAPAPQRRGGYVVKVLGHCLFFMLALNVPDVPTVY